ncbi:MAG: DUF4382 domain-containing protein [Dehalococcoidia bacterium]|nr:DUF4382 domain-containing protein [Dehalococcoidia bacterium]
MKRAFDQILDECIDRLNGGESVEECLKLYPEFAAELEPLLIAALEFRSGLAFMPSAAAKTKGKESLLREMAQSHQKLNSPDPSILQRLFGRPKIWAPVTAALMIAVLMFALWPSSSNPPGIGPSPAYAGTIEIRITDAPNHDVSSVYMTIGNIEVQKSGGSGGTGIAAGNDGDRGWTTVIGEERSFELLELLGVEEILGSKELEVGHYTQIRLDVAAVRVTVDGITQSAALPSGKLKLVGSFDIEAGKTTALTLDFDAQKSVVVAGNGKVQFKPVVKISVTEAH